jgi:hypothetical protein
MLWLVLPYFDYCSPLWDSCGSMLKEKIQKLQNVKIEGQEIWQVLFTTLSRRIYSIGYVGEESERQTKNE